MPRKQKPSYYAVHLPAHTRGVYRTWSETEPLVKGQRNCYKGFQTYQEAYEFSQQGRRWRNRPDVPIPHEQREPLAPIINYQQRVVPHAQRYTSPVPPSHYCVKPEYQSSRSNDVSGIPAISAQEPHGESIQDVEDGLAKYYAVARGRRPGLYDSWSGAGGAQEQTNRFSGAAFKGFEEHDEAITYMCSHGIARSDIRLFRTTFKPTATFKPEPTATFHDNFKNLAATQSWSDDEMRKVKITTIVNDLVNHYLPNGISPDQVDSNGDVDLTDEQTLTVYQGMLRSAQKPVHDTIDCCLRELKDPPYVNIMDFLKALREGGKVHSENNWDIFRAYTMRPGNRIDIKYAEDNEFLAPLLQRLGPTPSNVNPVHVRRGVMARKEVRMRVAAKKEQARQMGTSSLAHTPSLSPPASDLSPSPTQTRCSTPELDSSTSGSSHEDSDFEDEDDSWPRIKCEVQRMERDFQEMQNMEDELNGHRSSLGRPLSSPMEEKHLTQPIQLGKRAYKAETQDPVPRKRKRRSELEMLKV